MYMHVGVCISCVHMHAYASISYVYMYACEGELRVSCIFYLCMTLVFAYHIFGRELGSWGGRLMFNSLSFVHLKFCHECNTMLYSTISQ